MNDKEQIRSMLTQLREKARLSQAQIAEKVKFTASRVCRLESGDTELTLEDAEQLASAIGTDEAKALAEYLGTKWEILERPGFNHVNLAALWKAEQALQRAANLEGDPELKNAFVQQIKSYRQALERAANALRSTEHPVALIGAPGVGKTTIICTLAQLRRNDAHADLDKQMALQTGGGRQTLCEVHVRNGGECNVTVELCSIEEIQQYVSEFCDDLLSEIVPEKEPSSEGPELSAEAERAICNMTGLTIKRSKAPDGKTLRDDRALDLAAC